MNKKEQILRCFTHGYMFCTVVGIVLLFHANEIAICFLAIGANSIYVSFGVFFAANVSKFWGICSFLWMVLFPILFLVSYVYAIYKKHIFLHLAMALDFLVSILFVVYNLTEMNWYGLKFAVIDLIVSFFVLSFFTRVLCLKEK